MTTVDDTFISDDEDELCPLCVEEMDISDKNFKPCPCGYQICQFCYNNIKQIPELNGRCPGCRRLYDDDTVEYKTLTPEEYKMQQLKREKRDKEKKQREKERKENELANKKHLAGIRVVQKNLVYVTGLNPPASEDLHSLLRSDKYFGRYGKILKIVINKKTPTAHHNPGLVVYVTFVKKEDALKCINDMDGSLLDGKILRAAHGTTKYCSSYLRGHPCQNPNCMFLHEPGEEADSYTRKDLSTQQSIKMGTMKSSANSSDNEESKDDNAPLAAAPWAKASASTSVANSPSVNNNVPLNAFPTLGEIFKDQKQQPKSVKKKKKDSSEETNEYADLENSLQVLESITGVLGSVVEKREKLVVKFNEDFDLVNSGTGHILPLFEFNRSLPKDPKLSTAEEKLASKKIIDLFFLRPIKNYDLSYQNHPVIQQQILLQQQAAAQAAEPIKASIDQQQQLLLLQQLQKQQLDASAPAPSAPAAPTSNVAPPQATGGAPPGLSNVSSSSQLLTQLMSGKR